MYVAGTKLLLDCMPLMSFGHRPDNVGQRRRQLCKQFGGKFYAISKPLSWPSGQSLQQLHSYLILLGLLTSYQDEHAQSLLVATFL